MLGAALFALGFAVYQLLSFSLLQFWALGVAIIVFALLSRYEFRIPKTPAVISAGAVGVFWGTIWLGIPGGVLLAAAASLARYGIGSKNKKLWLFEVFANIFSGFAGAKVFYLILQQFAGFQANIVAQNSVSFLGLTAAIVSMAVVHYLLNGLLTPVFFKLEGEAKITNGWKETLLWKSICYSIVILTVSLLHFTFWKFGLAFGLVVLPLVILGHSAYKIHVARLAQKTREITEASRIHLATVEALATAIDARDQVGVGHVRRTQIYAIGVGEVLGLSEDEICALRTGALLHDIGKLAVPDHILNKPGRLTPAEVEKVKIHSTVGASILEKVGFPYPVVPTVLHHHEMFDGTGYPDKLKGENIPLTARILAVADAYDSLRGARPFRGAVAREEARRFLLDGAGTQFDPKIVDVFLRNLRRFEKEIEAEGLAYSFDSQKETFLSADKSNDKGFVHQIKRANREVFTLYELARVFSASLNLEETLSLFVKKIGELVPFDTCAVYLIDGTGERASAVFVEGKNSLEIKDKKVKAGEGATGFVLKKRQPVHKVNPGLDFTFSQTHFAEEYTAMTSLPLIAEGKLLGAVSLYSCEIGNYEEEHLRLLEAVSRIASDAISKSLYHAETETKALTDPMMALPNARSLQMQFEKEVARASRKESVFQVLMLDLDGFKAVNDTFGHKVGDEMLKNLAAVLREQLRDYDFLARYAGDEFVAIVPETTGEAVQELCCRIEKAVSEFALPTGDGRFAQVGISVGAASYPHHGDTLEKVLIAADKAMYSVKASHRQRKQPPILPIETVIVTEKEIISENFIPQREIVNDSFIVELDESHIVSAAIN